MTYTCAICTDTILTPCEDEDEFDEVFGTVPSGELATICNDCFHLVLAQEAGLISENTALAFMKPEGTA